MPKIIGMKNGQMLVTVPKQLAIAFRFKKGDQVVWRINESGKLELEKVKE